MKRRMMIPKSIKDDERYRIGKSELVRSPTSTSKAVPVKVLPAILTEVNC